VSAWLPARPWPLPAALGLALGIAARANDVPAWALLALIPLLWLLRPLLLRRSDGRHSRIPLRALLALLLPLVMVAIGYARFDHWLAAPDPLAGLRDRELYLEGVSDGRVLSLSEPAVARVAVSPAGALPPGPVALTGTLRHAESRRNPGGFDYRGYLLRRGVHGLVQVGEIVSSEPRRSLRDRLAAAVTAGLPHETAALMEAMTLGIKGELGDLRDTFAAAGLAHVLALSGLHVGLLLAAAGALLAPLGLLRYPALLALDIGYMLLVGASPSVVRAAVMVAVVLVSLWAGAGRVEPWPALGLAALVTLLARPAWLFDISLQLSYGAVAGILLFALPFAAPLRGTQPMAAPLRGTQPMAAPLRGTQPMAAPLRGTQPMAAPLRGTPPLPWWHPRVCIAGSLLTSAAAQSLTLPLVASSFGAIPIFSPLVNVVALPLAAVLVPLGFIAGALGLAWRPLAELINGPVALLAGWLIGLAEQGARLPALTWGEVEPVGYLYFVLAATALALAASARLRAWRALLVVALAASVSAATPPAHPPPEFLALDVGQGDSFLIRLPGRVEVLVDGGGSPFSDFDVGERVVLPALRALGVDELELVVASHADADHIEGLASVVRGIPVQLLAYGAAEPGRALFDDLMAAASERGVPVRPLLRGERLHLAGATLEVLNPPARSYGSSNDDSVALALYLAGIPRALLLGDISAAVERELAPPEVEILVAPHHGSPGSSSARLVGAARPRHAVVSAGINRYGHPRPLVLERLRAVGAHIHVTRDQGAVRLPLAR
jgi:competence protein ComEC